MKARLSQGGVDGAASCRPLPASGSGRVILGTGEGLRVSHMDSSPSTHIGSNPSIPTGSTPPTHTRANTSTLMGSSSVDPCSPSHPLWGSAPPLLLGAHGWVGAGPLPTLRLEMAPHRFSWWHVPDVPCQAHHLCAQPSIPPAQSLHPKALLLAVPAPPAPSAPSAPSVPSAPTALQLHAHSPSPPPAWWLGLWGALAAPWPGTLQAAPGICAATLPPSHGLPASVCLRFLLPP